MIIYRSFRLRMRNVSDKSCRENQNTYFMLNNFFSENSAVYVIKWKNIVLPDRPQMTIWRMSIACWIPEATTHSQLVTIITFPLQRWLHGSSSALHYAWIARLVLNKVSALHCHQSPSAYLKRIRSCRKAWHIYDRALWINPLNTKRSLLI